MVLYGQVLILDVGMILAPECCCGRWPGTKQADVFWVCMTASIRQFSAISSSDGRSLGSETLVTPHCLETRMEGKVGRAVVPQSQYGTPGLLQLLHSMESKGP